MADFSITGEVRLNSDPAEKSTSKWTVAAGQMIADFAKQASSKLAEVVKSGVDYNATMESYLTNFKVMLGSEEAAATKLSEIRKMAASTPFSLDDLTSGTQTLLQFGIAADDTTGVLQRLGDISLGSAEKLQTLTRAYGKMSSAQKVTLENVNMMIDAGFNPLNQICDATGESMSDLYKRISDGKVSFSELEAAVEAATSQGGQFYNGMLEASQTFSGRMSTLKDNVSALTGELTSGLFAALGELVVKLNEVVVSFLDSDEKMSQLKETIGIATAVVAAAGTAFLTYKGYVAAATIATKAHELAQAALNAVMAANPIALVVTALAALAAGLVTAYKTSETFRNAVNSAFASVKKIAQNAIGTVVDWINELVAKIRGAAAALANLKNGVGAAQEAYNAAYNGYMDNYNRSKLDKAAQERGKLHTERVKQAQEEAAAAKASAETISQSAGKAASAVSTSGKKASASAQTATATVVKSVSDTTTTVKDGITRTVETVNETLSNGKQQQKQTITETSRQMVDGVLKDVKTITEVAADGTKTVKQTMETVRETAKTVTSTFETLADGVKTTTQTVTETLTDGTETQKQVITETYDDVVDGALVTIERVKTIAADGTVQVAETIKKSAADTFDGLWKELQDSANTGVLGTFDNLYTAVKNQDWLSVGKWVASAIYSGLTADQKQQVRSFALGIVDKLNAALGGARDQLVQGAIDLGGQIVNGLTGGFSEVWQQAQGLGSTLVSVFQGLQGPLSATALAISQGLQGGLVSAFPEILAALGSLIGVIGSAFVAMLQSIGMALLPTGFGTPKGLLMIAAGVALVAAIAGIVAALGGSFSKKGSSGGGSSSGGSSGSGSMGSVDITTGSLEDAINANTKALEKTNSALADMIRQAGALVLSDNMRLGSTVAASGTAQVVSAARSYRREGDTKIIQNFYNGHDTAAAQQREARWEADKAKARKR
ncbi:MAG: tape measure protein [Faecalibacterium sp.]|nr:tape measure protein [Faecalibacterium sp.]